MEQRATGSERIESVRASTFRYVLARPVIFWLFVIAPVCIGLYGLQALFLGGRENGLFVFFFVPFITFAIAHAMVQREFMRQFAIANGFSFDACATLDGFDGALSGRGHSRKAYNMIRGTRGTLPIRIFNYQYTEGSGKNSVTYYFTIYEVTYPWELFGMSVEHAGFFNTVLTRSGHERLPLPREFQEHFDVLVEKGFEIEALELLTPDVLAELIDRTKKFQFEFFGSHAYVYESGVISTRNELQELSDFAGYIIERFGARLERLRDDIAALRAHTG